MVLTVSDTRDSRSFARSCRTRWMRATAPIDRIDSTILPLSFVFNTVVPGADDDRRDRELLGDLASGRPEALGELFDRHVASLFRHALVLTRQRPEAEDLVQAVLVKLATTGAELLGVRQPASYLHRMLHTTWIDGQRRKAVAVRAVEHVEPDAMAWSGRRRVAHEDAIDIALGLAESRKELRYCERYHRPHHHYFAMRKIDQAEDAVHHGVTECDQGVDAALHEAVDDLLEEDVHA